MSWDRVKGNWAAMSPRIRERWAQLTEDDFKAMTGRREQLSERIQQRYAIAREEADRQIDDWVREPGVLDDWNDRRPILDM